MERPNGHFIVRESPLTANGEEHSVDALRRRLNIISFM
jgi:hypothetical protein